MIGRIREALKHPVGIIEDVTLNAAKPVTDHESDTQPSRFEVDKQSSEKPKENTTNSSNTNTSQPITDDANNKDSDSDPDSDTEQLQKKV